MRQYRATDKPRLYEKSEVLPSGCIQYGKSRNKDGYGNIGVHDDAGKSIMTKAHIVAWELVNGPVPEGHVLDHVCHDPHICPGGPTCPHRACINEQHLKPVTREVNGSRERQSTTWHPVTVCKYGHEFTPENTYTFPSGVRACRECRRRWANEQNHKPEVRERQNSWRRGNERVLARRRARKRGELA